MKTCNCCGFEGPDVEDHVYEVKLDKTDDADGAQARGSLCLVCRHFADELKDDPSKVLLTQISIPGLLNVMRLILKQDKIRKVVKSSLVAGVQLAEEDLIKKIGLGES